MCVCVIGGGGSGLSCDCVKLEFLQSFLFVLTQNFLEFYEISQCRVWFTGKCSFFGDS